MRCRAVILDSFTAWNASHWRTGTVNGKDALKCQIWVLSPLIATTMDMGLWSASLNLLFHFSLSIFNFLHLLSLDCFEYFHSLKTNLLKKLLCSIPHIDLSRGWLWITNHSKRLFINLFSFLIFWLFCSVFFSILFLLSQRMVDFLHAGF